MPIGRDYHEYSGGYNPCLMETKTSIPFLTFPHGDRAIYFEGDENNISQTALIRRDTSPCTGDFGGYVGNGIFTAFIHLDVACLATSIVQLSQKRIFADPVTPTYDANEGYGLRVIKIGAAGVDNFQITLIEYNAGVPALLATPDPALVYGAAEWIHIGFEIAAGPPDTITVKRDPTLTPGLAWGSWATTYGAYAASGTKADGMIGLGVYFPAGVGQWSGVDYMRFITI